MDHWKRWPRGGAADLRRGDILVRQGEPSDALYFVLSGRFTVHVEGAAEPIAEIAQGQPIGEIGFFAGLPRTATVIALRDSSVLTITRERFQQISAVLAGDPRRGDCFAGAPARRAGRRAEKNLTTVRTVAVMPAGGSRPSPPFVDSLRAGVRLPLAARCS